MEETISTGLWSGSANQATLAHPRTHLDSGVCCDTAAWGGKNFSTLLSPLLGDSCAMDVFFFRASPARGILRLFCLGVASSVWEYFVGVHTPRAKTLTFPAARENSFLPLSGGIFSSLSKYFRVQHPRSSSSLVLLHGFFSSLTLFIYK